MEEKTLFPREEKSEILFKKISEDKWACEKLMETFCSYLFSNDGVDPVSYTHLDVYKRQVEDL